jgi:hypothetical protein
LLPGEIRFHKSGSQVLLSARRFGDVPKGLKKRIPGLFYFQLKDSQLKKESLPVGQTGASDSLKDV